MKKSILILSALLTILLTSCSKEVKEPIVSTSEDGKVTITVVGTRYTSMDPYTMSVVASIGDKEFPASVEAYIDDYNAEVVSFDWKDNRRCMVRIMQRDGIEIPIPVTIATEL